MKQVTFDVFDYNNDGKVSNLDLFKFFSFYDKDTFEKAFQKDIVLILKLMHVKNKIILEKQNDRNGT